MFNQDREKLYMIVPIEVYREVELFAKEEGDAIEFDERDFAEWLRITLSAGLEAMAQMAKRYKPTLYTCWKCGRQFPLSSVCKIDRARRNMVGYACRSCVENAGKPGTTTPMDP